MVSLINKLYEVYCQKLSTSEVISLDYNYRS